MTPTLAAPAKFPPMPQGAEWVRVTACSLPCSGNSIRKVGRPGLRTGIVAGATGPDQFVSGSSLRETALHEMSFWDCADVIAALVGDQTLAR